MCWGGFGEKLIVLPLSYCKYKQYNTLNTNAMFSGESWTSERPDQYHWLAMYTDYRQANVWNIVINSYNQTYILNAGKQNKYAIHAYTHGPVTGSGLSQTQ